MPSKGTPPVCPCFWIRCISGLLFAVAACFCALRAFEHPASDKATLVQNTLPGESSPEEAAEKPSIIIDPGHGGIDPGTTSHGQSEKTWTLSLGLALAKELRSRGWPVELTRETDTMVPVPDRSAWANRKNRLAFVSLHLNSGKPDAAGIETYYAWPRQPEVLARSNTLFGTPEGQNLVDDRSRLLAEALQASVCAATGAKNRGVRNDPSHSVTRRTICPAVLMELGFLTNSGECRNIQSEAYREKLVRGIADGLESWLHEAEVPGFGISFEEQSSVPIASLSADKNP
ncbi:MAG TPA: N-acetylmuramoyl-L-alanine amidase [Verrucomicrobiales bacterium]|nr:N-acetylmuramoyl-L-alanine amidase [Verrucomicrobiales bacterium]